MNPGQRALTLEKRLFLNSFINLFLAKASEDNAIPAYTTLQKDSNTHTPRERICFRGSAKTISFDGD